MSRHSASARSRAKRAAAGSRPRRGPRWWVVRGALLVALALGVVALVGQWNDVRDALRELTALGVAASGLATMLAIGATVLSWQAVLGGLGARLPTAAAVRVFCVGQVGKYIPGSVWPVLAQMELSRDYGVSRARSATASLVVLALAVPCGGLAAAVTLPFVSREALADYWWALAAVPAFAVVLHPAVLTRLLGTAFRLLRRPPLDEPLTAAPILAAAGWLLASFACYGVGTWLLARDLAPEMGGLGLLALSVGAYALAWTAGFLVLVLPAGAGVREAVLVLALAPALPTGPATLLALVARLLATIADLAWAGIGMALRPRGRAAPRPGHDPDGDPEHDPRRGAAEPGAAGAPGALGAGGSSPPGPDLLRTSASRP